MAARKRPKQAKRPGAGTRSGDPKQRLIAAALELAAAQGWRRLGMAEIAEAAGLSLKEAYGVARSKYGLLAALRRQTDEAMLAGGVVTGDSPRDRLFEALMRRFEALRPYRPGLRAVLRDSIGSPAAVGFLPGLLRSMGWTLSAAGLPAMGCRGRLARRFVGAIYVSVLPTFIRDEGADLGTTMAALDKRLRQAERLLSSLGPVLGGRRSAA
ncbi:MAG TPA: TetR family transcriptional regulator [Stellaceae bacterium]|nr:TetR family transcriptional regulator [Stellaceae bacterium]